MSDSLGRDSWPALGETPLIVFVTRTVKEIFLISATINDNHSSNRYDILKLR